MTACATRSLAGYRTEALRFDRLVGCGAMGDVYQGAQLRLGRQVAIKVVAPHLAGDPRTRERFAREATATARLHHPHVVACYDAGPIRGPDGDELFVLVLEYVDGAHLGKLACAERAPVRRVLEWLRQTAMGLHAAHAAGILHRDVKPENILIAHDGVAKLADFGLARVPDGSGITVAGAIVGTPQYLAPETAERGEVLPASDLYALGCTLMQALTGSPPFVGASAVEVFQQQIGAPPPRLSQRRPDLAALDDLVARALAKRPEDRFADAAAFAEAIRVAALALPERAWTGRHASRIDSTATAAIAAVPAPTPPPAAPPPPPRGGPLPLIALAVIAAAALLIAIVERAHRDRAAQPAAATRSVRELQAERDELADRLRRVERELERRRADDAR